MSHFQVGDEVKLKIGSYESFVTVHYVFESIGQGFYELILPNGRIMIADESILYSKQKPILEIFHEKAREFAIRDFYERMTGQSGSPGTGPADLIMEFLN